MGILWFIVFGLIIGLIARALLPGRQPMGLLLTAVVGVIGSFLGGFIGNMLAGRPLDDFTSAGFFGSLIGALVVLALLSPLMRRRRLSH